MKEDWDIYKELFDMTDILGVECKYITNAELGVNYDFGYTTIPKGTILHRIRRYEANIDYSDIKEWGPSPYKRQNRCNQEGETALYLGSTEIICILETNIPYGQQYVIGSYEVVEDIKLGGFIYINPNESLWKMAAGALLNSFLIAPSRSEDNEDIFEILDSIYSDHDFLNICMTDVLKKSMFLPSWIGAINKRDEYYKVITNKLCKILKASYPQGIRYSSCWVPAETVGIECSEYNIVLYEEGLSSVKYKDYIIKENKEVFTRKHAIESLMKVRDMCKNI